MVRISEDLINVEEAAELLGYHPEHVRRLARQGELPAVKVGNRVWCFSRAELAKWKAQRPKPGAKS